MPGLPVSPLPPACYPHSRSEGPLSLLKGKEAHALKTLRPSFIYIYYIFRVVVALVTNRCLVQDLEVLETDTRELVIANHTFALFCRLTMEVSTGKWEENPHFSLMLLSRLG